MTEKPLTIMTMAFDIGRYHPFILRKAWETFYNSIADYHTNFKIIIYTNLPSSWWQRDFVEIHHEKEEDFENFYEGIRWFNLTFHRFFILEKHMRRGEDIIWIDLDTIICGNLDFTKNLPNFFIKHGFADNVVTLNSKESLVQKEWIHGHVHKMDMNIVNLVHDLLNREKTDMPSYELMSVFSLLRMRHPEQFQLLNDLTDKHINLEWCYDPSAKITKINSLTAEHFHPEPRYIKNRIKMMNNKLYGYDGREFLLMTFTFPTLEMNLRENWKSIKNTNAKEYLQKLSRLNTFDLLKLQMLWLKSFFKKNQIKKLPIIGRIAQKIYLKIK